ncbi:MAG: SDR family NAD(P)-dependent oxidoreductase, partial [Alphaproteobacteria bacterium]|nr:SDR family NAD(P)-dependent oxidoreductase [Alphaproteobacteria bacterium]
MRMQDKLGMVTAAASGMGRAGAVRFAKEGAAVAVVDVDEAGVKAVVDEIETAGGKAVGIPADLTKDAESVRVVKEAANALGGLDFAWNHVGHPGPASIEGLDMADYDLAMTLNLRTILISTEAQLPELRARGGGSLLYTASVSGLVGSRFSPVYSAAKHGVVGYVKAMAKRYASENIRINALCPGQVDTPMLRVFVARPDTQGRERSDPEELIRSRAGQNPLGRP